ncbi:hypothetical protein GYMLUDRAFT_470672 [Collybiopsis luxurians FD-317 M1]|uniref:Unplaced genomic scaffold GYMLUscaffold_167, whole genome shotgun sequence n=1 Tax=Collybiopsis luxurians FD-317 M1 TaxID=944289 RepID=A0A0D0BLC0_9AGAR|nr:hypothetical protein GYMLUDRAFT_470672 [Collybiopsis luxurians FD-317 M1]
MCKSNIFFSKSIRSTIVPTFLAKSGRARTSTPISPPLTLIFEYSPHFPNRSLLRLLHPLRPPRNHSQPHRRLRRLPFTDQSALSMIPNFLLIFSAPVSQEPKN